MESKVYIDPYPKTMKMLGLERINIDCGNNTSIVTPANIAKDMVALLPDEVFIPESKFLDICCKSGIFLTSIREKLMNSKTMIESFPDDKERYKYITNNQLYGIAPNGQCQMYSVRAIYGTLRVDNPHILCFGAFDQYRTVCLNNNHKMLIEEMKKEFGQMKFDVVIGNPPYNKDIYLDFVTLGHTLASKYDCWITPAKWQAKETLKDREFRNRIVPYIRSLIFYPSCSDIFEIKIVDGITIYLADKEKHEKITIENKCMYQKLLESTQIRSIRNQESLLNALNDVIETINKSGTIYKPMSIEHLNKAGAYMVYGNKNISGSRGKPGIYQAIGTISYASGNSKVLGYTHIEENTAINRDLFTTADTIWMTSDNIEECRSFESWIQTKFVQFCLFGWISTRTINSDASFRKVPAPEAFDHIFTDEELYKKYNLTDEEINIIESVIKERK